MFPPDTLWPDSRYCTTRKAPEDFKNHFYNFTESRFGFMTGHKFLGQFIYSELGIIKDQQLKGL